MSNSEKTQKRELNLSLLATPILAVAIVYFIAFLCCYFGIFYQNPVTPPGYAGYVSEGAITGKSKFLFVQVGPTSSGAGWLRHVVNIPTTPRTYVEEFSGNNGVLSADNTRISFSVDVMWKLKSGNNSQGEPWMKVFAEDYATLHPGDDPEQIMQNAYNSNLRGKIQSFVRESAEAHSGMTLQDNMQTIADDVNAKIAAETANTPFDVRGIVVGYIHLPSQVTDQIAQNLIWVQTTAQSNIKISLTTMQAQIDAIDAQGLADAAAIINKSITTCWVQYKLIKGLENNVHSTTPTTIYIPSGPGGLPDVHELAATACKASADK
jgi:hypothetical protein